MSPGVPRPSGEFESPNYLALLPESRVICQHYQDLIISIKLFFSSSCSVESFCNFLLFSFFLCRSISLMLTFGIYKSSVDSFSRFRFFFFFLFFYIDLFPWCLLLVYTGARLTVFLVLFLYRSVSLMLTFGIQVLNRCSL